MNSVDQQYKDLLRYILKNGVEKGDRTGTGTRSIFGYDLRFNMGEGFPLITSKKMAWKSIVTELLWFLKGDTNIKYLLDNNCHIWDGDAYKSYKMKINSMIEAWDANYHNILKTEAKTNRPLTQEEFIERIKTDSEFAKKWGDLGPIYGAQWRRWNTNEHTVIGHNGMFNEFGTIVVDQIQNLIGELRTNPDSRRLMVMAWNVGDLSKMTLPPCHYGFQCYTYEMSEYERVHEWCKSLKKDVSFGDDMTHQRLDELGFPKRKLSLKATVRSNDIFLGNPFNIASYGLLIHLLSKEVNMIPNDLILSLGDAHIYLNHIDQCRKQLKQESYPLPSIEISNKSIFDIGHDDIKLVNYQSSPTIKGELSN
jgi:thymidylate synthase